MHVIRTFYSPEDAHTALSLLTAHGFNARLMDSQTLSVLPLDSIALGGYRLAVMEHEAEASLAFLEQYQPEIKSNTNEEYFGDEEQLDRNATQNSQLSLSKILLIAALIAFVLIVLGGFGPIIGLRNGLDWVF